MWNARCENVLFVRCCLPRIGCAQKKTSFESSATHKIPTSSEKQRSPHTRTMQNSKWISRSHFLVCLFDLILILLFFRQPFVCLQCHGGLYTRVRLSQKVISYHYVMTHFHVMSYHLIILWFRIGRRGQPDFCAEHGFLDTIPGVLEEWPKIQHLKPGYEFLNGFF